MDTWLASLRDSLTFPAPEPAGGGASSGIMNKGTKLEYNNIEGGATGRKDREDKVFCMHRARLHTPPIAHRILRALQFYGASPGSSCPSCLQEEETSR
jgi:hypothetical protein